MREAPSYAQPREGLSIVELREEASNCRACSLCSRATQTVFGEGPVFNDESQKVRLVLVGEQPGDEEDKIGTPFVGPAGRLLNEALAIARIDRSAIYLTNAVKHFKWEERGKRRLHKRPNGNEILACRPWLLKELTLIKPRIVICLGSTAAQSVLGKAVSITEAKDHVFEVTESCSCIVTYHPSAVLRAEGTANRKNFMDRLVDDVCRASSLSLKFP